MSDGELARLEAYESEVDSQREGRNAVGEEKLSAESEMAN